MAAPITISIIGEPLAAPAMRFWAPRRSARGRGPRESKAARQGTHDGQLSHAPLMRFLRIAEGLNTMTRRGEIGTSLPA